MDTAIIYTVISSLYAPICLHNTTPLLINLLTYEQKPSNLTFGIH